MVYHRDVLPKPRDASLTGVEDRLFNQTVCALRFLYNTTLGCKEMIEEIPYPRFEKRLPVVLSQTVVAAL